MEDIIRTVKGNPWVVLEAAKNLHQNLQFKKNLIVTVLTFLDLNVNVHSRKKFKCGWYQKATDCNSRLLKSHTRLKK